MDVVRFATSADLQVAERSFLKDRIADAYREVMGTTEEIGVDREERQESRGLYADSGG